MQKCENIWFIQALILLTLLFTIPFNSLAQSTTSSDETGFALLIDVSKYKDPKIPPLISKGRGIYEIRNSLHSAGGYLDNQIYTVTNERATREGVIEELTKAINSVKMQENARFFFYLKARYIKIQNEPYLLPYDARIGATSTYISLSELRGIWDKITFAKSSAKLYVWATWDLDYQGEDEWTSRFAENLIDEKNDFDGDRNITLNEINNILGQISSGISKPQIFTNSKTGMSSPLICLLSVLEVDSQPPGANVFIDNINKGVTPIRITGLTQGEHRLFAQKELYRQSEERIFNLNSTRGQRISIPPYQLIPIRIVGFVLDAEQNPVTNAEVWIDSTDYRQKVNIDGSFSLQPPGVLEPGKTYNIVIRSPDEMYSGKASFVFKGMEDISVNISAIQSDWLKLAQQRLTKGDNKGTLELLDKMLSASGTISTEKFKNIQQPLAVFFITSLKKRIQSEPKNLKLQITSAILSDIVGDVSTARNHWKTVKEIAPKESDEYKQAVARLKQLSLIRQPWLVAIISIGIFVLLAGLGISGRYLIRWMRFRIFREIPNPYIAGKPISEPNMFFGREDIFLFIRDKFSRNVKDITIVLHGGRRTGKTSIMYQIANGRLGQDFVPVFIDMQEMAGGDAHYFFRSIAQKVNHTHTSSFNVPENDKVHLDELLKNLGDKSLPAYQSFNVYIKAVASMLKGKFLIFLIDEYEILERKIKDGDLTDDIFTHLRHLMGSLDNLAFIFSGSGDFMRRERRKEWSLMFNLAQSKEVSFLSHENAIDLITKPVKDYVQYDKKAIERILRLTAGHPYFIQSICQQIIEELNERQQNKVTVEQVQHACNYIVENAPFHLSFVWSELTNDDKVMIALLAETIQDETSYTSPEELLSKMPNYGLEYDLAAISKSIAQLMEDHLIEKKPESKSYRFQMDLVREWIQAEHPVWGVLREVKRNE